MVKANVSRTPRNVSILLAFSLAALLLCACSRPAQTVTAAPAPPPPFEYVDAWGVHGDGPGQFAKPVAITSDDESIIYIADAATGFLHKFSPGGEPRLSFQDDRSNLRPADIAVDAGSAIYVADGRRGTVAIFFSDGIATANSAPTRSPLSANPCTLPSMPTAASTSPPNIPTAFASSVPGFVPAGRGVAPLQKMGRSTIRLQSPLVPTAWSTSANPRNRKSRCTTPPELCNVRLSCLPIRIRSSPASP